jgi:hypothetical protein
MNNLRRILTVAGLGAGMTLSTAFGSIIIDETNPGEIIQTSTINTGDPVADVASASVFDYFGFFGLNTMTLNKVTLQFTDTESIVSLSVTNSGAAQGYSLSVNDVDHVHSLVNVLPTADLNLINATLSGLLWDLGDPTGLGNGCDQAIGAGPVTQNWFTATNNPTMAPTSGAAGCSVTQTNNAGFVSLSTGVQTATKGDFLGNGTFNLSYTSAQPEASSNAALIASGLNAVFASQGVFTVTYQYAPSGAPEPTTMFLLGSGLVGLGFLRRRATKR